VISQGTVRYWDDNEGLGVLDSVDTPGGCWAHHSVIVMDGFQTLSAGDPVAFVFESGRQDGYSYRALQVWPPGVATGTPLPETSELSGAWITLTVESPDGTVTTYGPDDPPPWS
jgi:CspA family cold shock protein